MSLRYLCYDIKGIQQFIFSVPRLKCIVGASGQIAGFDEAFEKKFKSSPEATYIFAGGGRGAIQCRSQQAAEVIANELITLAHKSGLDIRIGVAEEFSTAVQHADELYPYTPRPGEIAGFPCSASGLFPVPEGSNSTVHPIIQTRMKEARTDYLGKSILDSVMDSDSATEPWPAVFRDQGYTVEFLRNVNPEPNESDDPSVDQARATAGKNSLGGRNRWAIIAMDGNDMGLQFELLRELYESELPAKLGIVSDALKQITRQAFERAFVRCIQLWLKKCKPEFRKCSYDEGPIRYLVLPFRPLILGGDDLVLLCHSWLAMEFARTMAREFANRSEVAAKSILKEHGFQPFPYTNGRLAISAGVLFSKVTLPLHTAIPYADSLLVSAKGAFRASAKSGSSEVQSGQPATPSQPTPAAIDWDAITDTMIDSPTDRRRRELQFLDEETNRMVFLTDRPYKLNDRTEKNSRTDFDKVLRKAGEMKSLPTSFRADLKNALNQVWSERMQFLISVSKDRSCQEIVNSLWEQEDNEWTSDGARRNRGFAWRIDSDEKSGKKQQYTDVLDAILLLDEDHRMNQELES